MSVDWIRDMYGYHWWANRRLFDVTTALGEEAAVREVGAQFSFPTLLQMFGHIYGADAFWLTRWKGGSPMGLPGADLRTLAALRERWDATELEQRAFVEAVTQDDLGRVLEFKNADGRPVHGALGALLHHVPNHATHHRSEVATMVTMISGSPPDTGRFRYELVRSGQLTA